MYMNMQINKTDYLLDNVNNNGVLAYLMILLCCTHKATDRGKKEIRLGIMLMTEEGCSCLPFHNKLPFSR